MKKTPTILPLLLLLILPTVMALQVTPLNTSIDAIRAMNNNITFTLRNNETYEIHNIILDAAITDASLPNIGSLLPGQEVNYTINLNPQSVYSQTYYRKFIYDAMLPTLTDLTNRQINITSYGYTPSPLNVTDGDTVTWGNKDIISHTITCNEFEVNLTPNESTTRTISGVRNLQYSDRVTSFGGWLYIINRSQLRPVRVVSNDVPVTIYVNSMAIDSYVEASIFDPAGGNMTLLSNQPYNGILQFRNPSNNLAVNITISTSDTGFTFLRNNFNVTAGQNTFIPFIFQAAFNESNITRTYIINYAGVNCRSGSISLTVYIPPGMGTMIDNSTAEFFIRQKIFCDAYPTSPFCITKPIIKEVNQTVFQEKQVPYSFTQTDVYDCFRARAEANEMLRLEQNFVKENLDDARLQIGQLNNNTAYITQKIDEVISNEAANRKKITTIYVAVGIVVVLTGFILFGYFVYKRYISQEANFT